MDASWLNEQLAQDPDAARERYQWFMRPEPKEVVSDVEVDPETGLRFQMRRLGMVRNAKAENKQLTKVYLDPLPHTIIEAAKPLQGWYKSRDETGSRRPRPCFTEAVLTEPYGGFCLVGCAFCYINSGSRGYRGTGIVTVPRDYGDQIRVQLSKMRNGAAGYFSSFTDPFMELEPIYHNTEQGARAFTEVGLPIFFLSRLSYPGWAYDLLSLNPHSYAQKSINTPDQRDWKKLSPGALSLDGHFAEIRELHRRGIYVSIQVNPVIPGVTSVEQVEELFALLRDAGADHVIVKFVEAAYSWAPYMIQRIKQRFGEERGARFESLFNCNIGHQRTIDEGFRIDAHMRLQRTATQLGLTYATCYEYRFLRDADGKIVNRTGVSMGREFATADQCHGHRVPVYVRNSAEEPFRPLDVCPPSGCLHCADENAGEPMCGDQGLGEAKARRFEDFRGLVQIGQGR